MTAVSFQLPNNLHKSIQEERHIKKICQVYDIAHYPCIVARRWSEIIRLDAGSCLHLSRHETGDSCPSRKRGGRTSSAVAPPRVSHHALACINSSTSGLGMERQLGLQATGVSNEGIFRNGKTPRPEGRSERCGLDPGDQDRPPRLCGTTYIPWDPSPLSRGQFTVLAKMRTTCRRYVPAHAMRERGIHIQRW